VKTLHPDLIIIFDFNHMNQTSDTLQEEMQKLLVENSFLRQQLQNTKESINAIKTGNIDALIIGSEKSHKIYSEKTSDEIYRILIERMNEGAVVLNTEGTILYCNAYFANMLGLPLQNTIGEKINRFLDHLSESQIETLLKQGNERPVNEEVYLKAENNVEIPVLISASSLVLDNNTVLSITITDLTIQHTYKKELQNRASLLEQINSDLENANKDLSSFTYVSSHDLQEPLRKIQNFVTYIILEDEKTLSETAKYYFQRIGQSANRMQALITDLLTYSNTKSSERTLEDTDLNIIIDEIKEEYKDNIGGKKLTIETMNIGHVNIIPFQFRQLFQNLVSNSVKFSKPQTAAYITIQAETIPGNKTGNPKLTPGTTYCHITYTDNGIGFDPQYSEYIFDVFKRLYTKEEYEGTGIGLAICKRVVENHHGVITATGALNQGARFDIYIPA
jgi:PAS domain S-box-containing protein